MVNKITQKQRYEALIDLVNKYGISITNGDAFEGKEEMVAFLESRIEGLDKKASFKSAKVEAERDELKGALLDILSAEGKALKISEILQREPIASMRTDEGLPISSQKLSYMANALAKAGVLTKTSEKKVSYFSVA